MSTKNKPKGFFLGPQSRYRSLPFVGPLLDDLLAWFWQQRYSESTIHNHIQAMSRLIRWLQTRLDPELSDLNQVDLRRAYDYFRVRRYCVASAARVLGRFLRERQLIPEGEAAVVPPSELELDAFNLYLRKVRGLSAGTIASHKSRLRSFLQFLQYDENPSVIRTVDLGRIEQFLCKAARTNNRFSLQHLVGTIRAFLRHQHAQGILPTPLYKQIDTARTYRLEKLPRALPWEQIIALLRSIDQSKPAGLRDFTLLFLAARYGLRSRELVALRLDDFGWRSRTLRIPQSKTKQTLLLPLSDETVDVLVHYLRGARPVSEHRELFLRRKAPMGPLSHCAVHDILDKRICLSGLDIPKIGTHALRHSLAVHLLRSGASIYAIGNVLGHRNLSSTAVYLRLAVEDLREVDCQCLKTVTPLFWSPMDGRANCPGFGHHVRPDHRLRQQTFAADCLTL